LGCDEGNETNSLRVYLRLMAKRGMTVSLLNPNHRFTKILFKFTHAFGRELPMTNLCTKQLLFLASGKKLACPGQLDA
jgi:hypothetical protein